MRNQLNIRDLVIDFYHKYYSANQMKLVVYSKESLDQIQSWVVDKFQNVPDMQLHRPIFPTDPFTNTKKVLLILYIVYTYIILYILI